MREDIKSQDEFYFQWHLTDKCNLRCKHCYQENYLSENEVKFFNLKIICDRMEDAAKKWGRKASLSLTGGEPLLLGNDLYSLMDYIETKDGICYYDLLTNGILINREVVKTIKNFPKLRRVQLSLEGHNAETNDHIRGAGTFNHIVNAIEVLKENDVQVSVMYTLNRHNLESLPLTMDLLRKLEVDTFSVERFIPEGRGCDFQDTTLTPEELRNAFFYLYELALNEQKPKILLYRPLFAQIDVDNDTVGAICSIGTNALTVMPDGTVYPCRRLPISLGNVLIDGFFKIWYDSKLLWEIRNPENYKGKCKECQYFSVCRGCRAAAYFLSNDYLAEDPQCWMPT